MTKKKKPLLPDKKHAPKKTGKRLPIPEDPNPEEKIEKLTTIVTKQQDSPLAADNPPKPKVVGDRFEAFYYDVFFEKVKGVLYVAMAFSVVLEKEHKDLMPKLVAEGYHDISKKGRKRLTLEDLPGQRVEIFLAHDSKEETLFIPAAYMTHAALALIERKGEGTARKVIRFSFHLKMPVPIAAETDPVSHFAERNLENSLWLRLEDADPKLFDE